MTFRRAFSIVILFIGSRYAMRARQNNMAEHYFFNRFCNLPNMSFSRPSGNAIFISGMWSKSNPSKLLAFDNFMAYLSVPYAYFESPFDFSL